MSTYGISRYGQDKYGLNTPVTVVPGGGLLPAVNNAYLIDPFTAVAVDYQNVLLTWTAPVSGTSTPMTEFRLLSSRWGFPVDQNDGNVLLDTTASPGSHFVDQGAVPGQMMYYGFYICTGSSWVRAGFAACLMPKSYDYASRLWSYLPEYLRDVANNELTADAAGDTYLWQFLQVAGFSLDYLKTQYDFLFNYQNDPMKMSFKDLAQLAAQLGMPFSGEIPAFYLRTAVDNWTTVMQERGTLAGIAEHISLLSGYGADVQLARNIMLEDDQSRPLHPMPSPWAAGIAYLAGEQVTWPVYPSWVPSQAYIVNNYVVYNGVNYQCIATGGAGIPPTGATTSGTYWAIAAGPYIYQCTTALTAATLGTAPPPVGAAGTTPTGSNGNWALVYDQDATANTLAITGLAGGQNTWEVLTASGSAPSPAGVAAGSLAEDIGIRNPANWANDISQNSFRVENRGIGIADGTFASGVGNWSAYGATVNQSSYLPYDGKYCAQVIITGTPAQMYLRPNYAVPVVAGQAYTATMWMRGNSSQTFGAAIDWRDVNQNYLTTSSGTSAAGSSTWTQFTVTGTAPAGAAYAVYGPTNPSPAASSYFYVDDILFFPGSTGTNDTWFRSVSRQASDVTAGLTVPDQQLVIEHGIPVPQPGQPWNASTRYATGSLVEYAGRNWLALRASTGATPPSPGVPLNANYNFPTGITGWSVPSVPTGTSASISYSNTVAYQGTGSLQVVFSGTASAYASSPGLGIFAANVAVEPGSTLSASTWVACTTAGVVARVGFHFLDAFGQFISSTFGPNVTLTTAGNWYQVTRPSTTVPANAVTAQFELEPIGPTATTSAFSYTYNFDLAEFTLTGTPEWAPVGQDARVPLTISAQTSQNWSVSAAEQFAIYPFTEFYDSWGSLITRAFSRTPTAGTPGNPSTSNYLYDSFMSGAGLPLFGRTPDTGSNGWYASEGNLTLDGNGNVFAPNPAAWSLGVIGNLPSTSTYAVTFAQGAQAAGMSAGLVFWYTSYSNRWAATMTGLWYNNGGNWTQAATYTTPFLAGDRIYVVANQATPSIAVYRNVIGAHNASTGNGQVASISGTTAIPAAVTPGTTSQVGIMNEPV